MIWKQWVNAVLGLIVLAAPFALTGTTLSWTLAIAGLAVIILSVWSALEMNAGWSAEQESRFAHR